MQENRPDPGDTRGRRSSRPSPIKPAAERRRRMVTRAVPIALVAIVAFVVGAATGQTSTPLDAARTFATAWAHGDLPAMHQELSEETKKQYPLPEFERLYDDADTTATIASVHTDTVESAKTPHDSEAAAFDVIARTNAFGSLHGRMVVPLDGNSIDWDPTLVFPGLRPGERLERRTRLPTRASILATNGTPLATGPAAARTSPLGPSAAAVAGTVSAPKAKQASEQEMLGFPATEPTGTSGLELAFNERLQGHPGGQLLAVGRARRRILASTNPIRGKPVHTTIVPSLQDAAVTALGSTLGGVAVLDAKTGDVLGLAGIAFSGPQPPGSTFKLVTTTAALDAGIVKTSDQFPVETQTNAGGRIISNANNESCGGSFVEAFALSCNTVFAPLGPKLGDRLVSTAEEYGFNSPPSLYNDAALAAVKPEMSTLPKEIPNPVDLAVTAIGQGEVLATPLQMASISQAIANGGVSDPTSIVSDKALRPSREPVKVTSKQTANTIRQLMLGVVHFGTGVAAQIPGIEVAGKTGTAELGPVAGSTDLTHQRKDAWFTAFAPASDPQLAVAAMVVNANGDGGTIAAPIVRSVLESGLSG